MPRQVDHGLRRRELVEASWEVMAREGIEGTTLRKVAAVAGCTTGRIAHYFSSRRELILAALQAAYTGAGARMAAVAEQEHDPRERLRQVVHEGLPLDAVRLKEWKVWIEFWAAAAAIDDLAAENARRYRHWQGMLAKLIGAVAQAAAAERLALELVSMIDGLGIRATLVPSAANRKLTRAVVDRWIDALG